MDDLNSSEKPRSTTDSPNQVGSRTTPPSGGALGPKSAEVPLSVGGAGSRPVLAFQEQVKKGNLEAVEAALRDNPGLLNAKNESGQTAFLLAHYYRQAEVAKYLLSLGPELDVFSQCVAGQTEAVLTEVDRDPKLLAQHSSDGWTPLHLAVYFGHPELAKGLLNRAADREARSTNGMNNTPLHAAAAGGNLAAMRVLLEAGADANARQHGGWTALHAAAQNGNRPMAELLLAHGADPSLRADNNQSAHDMAMLHGKADLVDLLEKREEGARLA